MDQMNRRSFLGTAAAGAAALGTLPAHAADSTSSTPKLRMGLIGCGWYGMVDVEAAFKAGGGEITAICDVDSEHLRSSAERIEKLQGARPRTFKMYSDMLEKPRFEALIIATPPHWHALPFIMALEKGLDIYCEKPLAYDIREGRAMVKAAQKHKRIVQVGFQRRQSAAIQQARDYIQAGNAGRIVHVEAQIHYAAGIKDTSPQSPPESLDWDLWCGPAPKLPYCPQVGHMAWRLEKEYGNGHLVDWGIHLIDATRWILGETTPTAVQASGGTYFFKDRITTPDILTAHFDFARCPVIWRHHIWGAAEHSPDVSNGIFFYGEKETVFVTDDKWIIIPKGKPQDQKVTEVKSDAGLKHMVNFLDSVRTRTQPVCVIEDAYCSAATVQLAMIAYQTGARLSWDGEKEQILGNKEASDLLMRPYRAPWQHPYLLA